MTKIKEDFLKTWIKIIVPVEFLPDTNPLSQSPLLGIFIVSEKKLEYSRRIWNKKRNTDENNDKRVLGQLINVGDLMRLAGKEPGLLITKYVIRLNQEQSMVSFIFSLAHEIGHLYGEVYEPEKHNSDPDGYADAYAFKRVTEVIEDEKLRASIIYAALVSRD